MLGAEERDQSLKCLRTEFETQHPHKKPGVGLCALIDSVLGDRDKRILGLASPPI